MTVELARGRVGWREDWRKSSEGKRGWKEGWVVYRQHGGSSGCSPLGSGLLCVGCRETDVSGRTAPNHPRSAVCFSLKHSQKCPLLCSAPHPWCENLGPTDRRSIKRSICVCAWAGPKWAWIPAPLQPLKMLELLIGVFPTTQRAQSPASCSHRLLSLPPACAALFSCCCVTISSVKHQGWEPGSSVCIYFLFSSPSKDNGISLGPKSLLG